MRYCDRMNLTPGMVLAKPLYSENNELLLSKGYELNPKLIEHIQRLVISPVCVEEPGTEGIVIDDILSEGTLAEANNSLKEVYSEVLQTAKNQAGRDVDEIANRLQASGYAIPVQQVKKAVAALIDELLESMAAEWTTLPMNFMKGSQFRHSVDVAILSLLIGMHFQFRYTELKHLGMGAVLHDLGMTLIPELDDKKNCEFTPEELLLYRKHPQYGISLLANHGGELFIERVCVMQHHEQPNGQGFPDRLLGSHVSPAQHKTPAQGEIFRLVEIIHAADAYLNLTTGGWRPEPASPEDSLYELIKGAPTLYNLHVISAISHVVVRFPKGAHVQIIKNSSDQYIGYHGVVAQPNSNEPHKPLLVLFANRFGDRIKPLQVDFQKEKQMEIKLVM